MNVTLPWEELVEVLKTPKDKARNLFISACYDAPTATITLTRGDLQTLVVPLALFRPSGTTIADPTAISLIDCGQTIKLGDYEAAADAVLEEMDPNYR